MVNLPHLHEHSAGKSPRAVAGIIGQTDSAPANSPLESRHHRPALALNHPLSATLVVDRASSGNRLRYVAPLRPAHAKLRRLRRLLLYLRPQSAQAASGKTRAPTWFQDQNAAADLFHRHQLSADYRHGGVLVLVPQSFPGEVVWGLVGQDCKRSAGSSARGGRRTDSELARNCIAHRRSTQTTVGYGKTADT